MADAFVRRLQSRPQFQAVLAGQIVAKTRHFAMHCKVIDAAPAGVLPIDLTLSLFEAGVWLGAMTPKRWAKRAVTRNAIKRQIYAVGACLNSSCVPAAYLVRLRQEFSRQSFPSASSKALQAAVRLELVELLQRGLQPK